VSRLVEHQSVRTAEETNIEGSAGESFGVVVIKAAVVTVAVEWVAEKSLVFALNESRVIGLRDHFLLADALVVVENFSLRTLDVRRFQVTAEKRGLVVRIGEHSHFSARVLLFRHLFVRLLMGFFVWFLVGLLMWFFMGLLMRLFVRLFMGFFMGFLMWFLVGLFVGLFVGFLNFHDLSFNTAGVDIAEMTRSTLGVHWHVDLDRRQSLVLIQCERGLLNGGRVFEREVDVFGDFGSLDDGLVVSIVSADDCTRVFVAHEVVLFSQILRDHTTSRVVVSDVFAAQRGSHRIGHEVIEFDISDVVLDRLARPRRTLLDWQSVRVVEN
jgi:hypothetical protein